MRVRVRNTSPLKRFPENRANGSGIGPMPPSQAARLKLMRLTQSDLGGGEKRIIRSPQLFRQKVFDPLRHDGMDIIADWEEKCREGLTELGIDLPSVLIEFSLGDVNVLELQRGYCSIAGTSQQSEGDQRLIPPLDLRPGRHHRENMADLL